VARKFADDLLDEIRIKTKLVQSVTGRNLAKMAEEFETGSPPSPRRK